VMYHNVLRFSAFFALILQHQILAQTTGPQVRACDTIEGMKTVLYARVSTKKMKKVSKLTEEQVFAQNPENQLRVLRTFAASQGWTIVHEYVDRESGVKKRPSFEAMLEAATRREFDVVLFWSIDRFSREGVLPTLQRLADLSRYGVKYRSYQESFVDTTHPFGDVLTAFVAKVASLERERIRERISIGLERARAEGKHLGRPAEVRDHQRVWDLRAQGSTVRQIVEDTGYSHGAVQRILDMARGSKLGLD
jgi:DNA invertase Pin-like site-specific DNA recombinase